jgi:hypothetical protein
LNKLEAAAENANNELASTTTTLVHGLQALTTDQTTPLNPTLYGRTLVNIPGKDGNCESLTPFTTSGTVALSTTQKKSGSNSIKMTCAGADGVALKDYSYPLDTAKQYFLGAWVYLESYTSGTIVVKLQDFGAGTERYVATVNTSTVGSWQFVYVKIPTSNTLVGSGFRLVMQCKNPSTCVAYFDEIRLYEVSASDYAAIGTTYTATSRPSIDDVWPYCDSVQHVTYPVVTKYGKNLLPPFSEWTLSASTVSVIEPYQLQIINPASSFNNARSPQIPVIPSTTYTIRFLNNRTDGLGYVEYQTTSGSVISTAIPTMTSTSSGTTFVTPSNCAYIVVQFDNRTVTGTQTFTYSNPILNLGSTAETFEPRNDDYVYGITDSAGQPLKLASNVDGTVRDALYWRDGFWYKTKRFVTDVQLTGALTYSLIADATGYKQIAVSQTNFSGIIPSSSLLTVVKYDGKPLRSNSPGTGIIAADDTYLGGSNLNIGISDTDSGWGETYTPSAAEVQAYFNGWKMYNSATNPDGTGTYNGTGTKAWARRTNGVDGTAGYSDGSTTFPTTLATGFTPYKLTYQLAATQTEAVNVEGSLTLHSGGNQIEVGEGVVVRERVTPSLSSDSAAYGINVLNGVGGNYYPVSSALTKRARQILAVYKNGSIDKSAVIESTIYAYGTANAYILRANYDATAEYTVTYLALDKYSLTSGLNTVSAEYWGNVGSVVAQNSKRISDIFPTLGALRRLLNPSTLLTMVINASGAAASFLGLIKTVDGTGSGLDADTLQGAIPTTGADANGIIKRDSSGGFAIPGGGTNAIYLGNGDGASFSNYNTKLRLHWGLGMETFDGAIHGYYDSRTGKWDVHDGYYVSGVKMGQTRLNGTDLEYWNGSAWKKSGLPGFGGTIAANGYQVLPSGLIIQWGTAAVNGPSGITTTINLPMAFPSVLASLTTTIHNATSGSFYTNTSASLSQFTVYNTTGINCDIFFIAIGY